MNHPVTTWRPAVQTRLFVVQLERHAGGDHWIAEGEQVTRSTQLDTDTPLQVGMDYALDRLPDGDDWRVLVWEATRIGGIPSAVVRPADTSRQTTHVIRAGRKHMPPRVRGPVGEVVSKIKPLPDRILGTKILVTRDAKNRVGTVPVKRGAWYVANTPAGDVQPASVRQVKEDPATGTVELTTSVGIVIVPARGAVIPA